MTDAKGPDVRELAQEVSKAIEAYLTKHRDGGAAAVIVKDIGKGVPADTLNSAEEALRSLKKFIGSLD